MDKYDMRLDRPCHYSYSVSIAENDNIPSISKKINSDITPLIALYSDAPVDSKSYLTIKNDSLITTAVEPGNKGMVVRMYNASNKPCLPEYETPLQFSGKTDVAGRRIEGFEANAFEIFELLFH
jgi:hypothetical protein